MSKEEQFKKDVKEILLNGDSKIGFVETQNTYEKSNEKLFKQLLDYEGKPPFVNRAMPYNLYILGKEFGIGFPKDIEIIPGNYESEELIYSNTFLASNNTENQKKEISKREKDIDKLRNKIAEDNTGKYDRKGIIYLPKYETNNETINFSRKPVGKESEVLEIEVTQRELAEAGILPNDFKWVEKAKVSAKDIAEADREQKLTMTEVGGVKGFIKKILDKFRGIGEK